MPSTDETTMMTATVPHTRAARAPRRATRPATTRPSADTGRLLLPAPPRLGGGGVFGAVVREEELLERRLPAEQLDYARSGQGLQERLDRALDLATQVRPV